MTESNTHSDLGVGGRQHKEPKGRKVPRGAAVHAKGRPTLRPGVHRPETAQERRARLRALARREA